MIKILMCGNHPSNKGGMTSVIKQILDYNWSKESIKMDFIPTFKPGNIISKSLFFGVAYIKITIKMLIDKPDIVHIHMSYKGSFVRSNLIHFLCKKFGVKDIIHLHGSEFEKWYLISSEAKKRKIRRLLSECSIFVVLGENWKKIVKKIEPSTKIEIINNCIKIPDKVVKWRENEFNILYLGVLIPRKGVGDLIDAVKEMKDADELGCIRVIIAGTGPEEEKLKEKVKTLELTNVIRFVGWIDGEKKKQYLENSQAMVSPSYNEGLPISILEAVSYGMPIVSTDVGDISSVIINNENGILFKPGDKEQLKKGMRYISDKNNFTRLSHNSREIAKDKYSIDDFYSKLHCIYKELGGTNPK